MGAADLPATTEPPDIESEHSMTDAPKPRPTAPLKPIAVAHNTVAGRIDADTRAAMQRLVTKRIDNDDRDGDTA